MSNATIPSALYKYLAPCRAALIQGNLRIRFSQVSVLNDVDEFQPPYKGVAPRAEIERTVHERFPKQYPREYAASLRNLGPVEAELWIEKMVPLWADTVEANYEKSIREVYARLDSNFGVLSLSGTVTSKLMWSFYSDGGTGIVVEFDAKHPWFNCKNGENDSYRHLRQVQYVADREPIYLATKDDAATREDDVLYTKTIEWEFEKEWRIIRGFKEAKEKIGADQYGKDIFLFEIPPSAIKSVIFGYRADPQLEGDLRKIVTTNANLKHLVFMRAVRNVFGNIEIVPAMSTAL
jgi:hypothetical protein